MLYPGEVHNRALATSTITQDYTSFVPSAEYVSIISASSASIADQSVVVVEHPPLVPATAVAVWNTNTSTRLSTIAEPSTIIVTSISTLAAVPTTMPMLASLSDLNPAVNTAMPKVASSSDLTPAVKIAIGLPLGILAVLICLAMSVLYRRRRRRKIKHFGQDDHSRLDVDREIRSFRSKVWDRIRVRDKDERWIAHDVAVTSREEDTCKIGGLVNHHRDDDVQQGLEADVIHELPDPTTSNCPKELAGSSGVRWYRALPRRSSV
ncbi:hypothetical protein ACLMJK_002983 [Lecanora helva]